LSSLDLEVLNSTAKPSKWQVEVSFEQWWA
jgi:hypothetical protein